MGTDSEQQQLKAHLDNLRHDTKAINANLMVPTQVKNACAEMVEVLDLLAKGVRLG